MPFDPKDFEPVSSKWFGTEIEYEGWGRAEFSDPKGSLEGPVSIRFDELGGASIEMTPALSTLRSERELRFGLEEFLSGRQPTLVDDRSVLSMTFESRNPCTKLEVETPLGIFRTQEVTSFSTSSVYGDLLAGVETITFDVLWSEFHAADGGEAKYWVLPLTNFVSDLRW
jgi:hypothetical protein